MERLREKMKNKFDWLKTSTKIITIVLLIICLLLLGLSFIPFFRESTHIKDNIENILIGIGTNIVGIIVTISFVQYTFDKHNEDIEKQLEKEKILRFSQIMSFRIEKYFKVFAQITTPLNIFSKQKDKTINFDFKFEDMKDLYFPCLLMCEEQNSAISVFYSEEKKIKEYMLRMLENIEFKYYPNIKNMLLAFIKQSEANDVSNAVINYESMRLGNQKATDVISKQIATNNVDKWVEKFESRNLPSNLINNFVILFRLLQTELFLLTEFNKTIQLLEKEQ